MKVVKYWKKKQRRNDIIYYQLDINLDNLFWHANICIITKVKIF